MSNGDQSIGGISVLDWNSDFLGIRQKCTEHDVWYTPGKVSDWVAAPII